MLRKSFLLVFVLFSFLFISEVFSDETKPNTTQKLINVNPNPNGEPWIAGGYPIMTKDLLQKIESLPELDLSHRNINLPEKVNNAEEKYFRPVFLQQGGSCAQASGIAYQYTYEICFEKDIAADTEREQFPSHYTWNFLNEGIGQGSITSDGWDMINGNGCPSLENFGGMEGGDVTNTKWMTGYDKYHEGMKNRVTEIFRIKVNTEKGLNTLKQFLFDHGNRSKAGGLANFSVNFIDSALNDVYMEKLPPESEDSGKFVIPRWGQIGGHAMTFVGYNDNIKYDFNGDGKFTNDKDINKDGKVDLKDWEKGALIVANSWGPYWPDTAHGGFVYMMYKVCAEQQDSKECGIGSSNNVLCISTTNKYEPKLTYKIKLEHNSRKNIQILAGISHDMDDEEPNETLHFPIFNFQGGNHPLEGLDMDKELEIGLDITPLQDLLHNEEIKFFLVINSLGGSGEVKSFSLLDYRQEDVVETKCEEKDVDIEIGKTVLSIICTSDVNGPMIVTEEFPNAKEGEEYEVALEATGGKEPYKWAIKENVYDEEKINEKFPTIDDNVLKPVNIDDGIIKQKLDFKFPFYGEEHKDVYVSTDGSILFSNDFEYIRARAAIPRNRTITPLGGDLTFEVDNDDMYYKGNKKEATFRWKTTKFWGIDEEVYVDFVVKLYKTGEIKFFYHENLTANIPGLAYGFSAGTNEDYHLLDFKTTSDVPYNQGLLFTPQEFPDGMKLTEEGVLKGTPTEKNKSWNLVFICTDANGISRSREIVFKVDEVSIVNKHMSNSLTNFQYSMNSNSPVLFSFNAKYDQNVKLEIFNGMGRKIETVVNSFKKAGKHKAVWNVKNSNGFEVPCGMYLCKLSINKGKFLKKIMFVK